VELWIEGPISCTSLTLRDGQVEIRLASNGTVISRTRFQDHDEAARYAIDKMHAYNVAYLSPRFPSFSTGAPS
jgi:hypothetical protein